MDWQRHRCIKRKSEGKRDRQTDRDRQRERRTDRAWKRQKRDREKLRYREKQTQKQRQETDRQTRKNTRNHQKKKKKRLTTKSAYDTLLTEKKSCTRANPCKFSEMLRMASLSYRISSFPQRNSLCPQSWHLTLFHLVDSGPVVVPVSYVTESAGDYTIDVFSTCRSSRALLRTGVPHR